MSTEMKQPTGLFSSLSVRLLVLTVTFVMLAEVMIFVPSIARFRLVYLEERIDAAHLASLALEATPNQIVSPALEAQLLARAMVHAVVIKRPESRSFMLGGDMPPVVDAAYDLGDATPMILIADAFMALLPWHDRIIRIDGVVGADPNLVVQVIIDEKPMQAAMYDYAGRIITLSIVISLVTAVLVYLSLHWLLVRPMRRITQSMVDFRDDPEDPTRTIDLSDRSDEVGIAQRELADMQSQLRGALRQKTHLAALGTAVSKINHDLRNILATAQLVSDRLAGSEDPEVKRVAPTLVRSLDRAVALCTNTLRYGRAEEARPSRVPFELQALVEDVTVALGLTLPDGVQVENQVGANIVINADREQIFRVLLNLGRNAADALSNTRDGKITVTAAHAQGFTEIRIVDNGPGVPDEARDALFEAFSSSSRSGGTGLGLAIAKDLMVGHGGDVKLLETNSLGTVFQLILPDVESASAA